MIRKLSLDLSVLTLLWATAALATETREWQFQMFLDDRQVGEHRVVVQRDQEETRVLSEAKAEVRILAIPFFRYHHRSEEEWRQGCMSAIRARTEKNGDTRTVNGSRQADQMRLDTPEGVLELGGCVRSFAYWDLDLLRGAEALLNSETGQLHEVDLQALGTSALPLGGDQAERYRLRSGELDIHLWYREGQWVGLESTLREGGTLRYQLSQGDRG